MSKRLLLITFVWLIFVSSANAVPILDQSLDVTNGAVNFRVLAQTFTVGITGNLTSVEVATFTEGQSPPSNATVKILGTAGGVPDLTQELISVNAGELPAPALPFKSINLTPLPVAVGDVLALAVFSPDTNNWAANFESVTGVDAYTGGTGYTGIFAADNVTVTGFQQALFFPDKPVDFLFKTFVDATPGTSAPIPEPSTMLLLGSGLAGLGWYRRRGKVV